MSEGHFAVVHIRVNGVVVDAFEEERCEVRLRVY